MTAAELIATAVDCRRLLGRILRDRGLADSVENVANLLMCSQFPREFRLAVLMLTAFRGDTRPPEVRARLAYSLASNPFA